MRKPVILLAALLVFFAGGAFAQDPIQFGLAHLKVVAEDAKVRVLKFTPKRGDKTPMHSHPSSVVYVIKGGRVQTTLPDGTVKVTELKTGDVLLRPPVTHADEALDEVEVLLVELKK